MENGIPAGAGPAPRKRRAPAFPAACASILLAACTLGIPGLGGPDPYYLCGSDSDRRTLSDLFVLLEKEQSPGEERFTVVREIANELLRVGEHGKLNHFLTSWVALHPDDPYNAYLLFMAAFVHDREGAAPLAAYYFDRIVRNYPDIVVKDESVHLASLRRLIEIVEDPPLRIYYYQELISRFPDRVDLGTAYFQLARAYEATGDWDRAIKTYTQFLPFVGSSVPGFPDAFGYAKKIVDFHNSPKDWTYESLPALVAVVKDALQTGNARTLMRCRAKVNFFAMSWEQDPTETNAAEQFNFSDFMLGNRIRYADSLDSSSNLNEAYLRTWGWSQRISTWYLYFRKINFPADPEIHGRWEWAGIYYGEKF